MRKALLALLLLAAACATAPPPVQTHEQAITAKERLLMRALARYDYGILNGLLSDDFTCSVVGDELNLSLDRNRARFSLCTGIGQRRTTVTDEQIESFEKGLPRSVEVLRMEITREADTAVVVSDQVYRRWVPYDGGFERRANVTDTWVRRDGDWRLLKRVSTIKGYRPSKG
jgi:hypothetical protein